MNVEQLLTQLRTNRDLIQRNNQHANEHLQMLKKDYSHLENEEVALSMALNSSLSELHFNSNYAQSSTISLAVLEKFSNSQHYGLVALHLKIIGNCYTNTGEFALAEKYLLQALEKCEAQSANCTQLRTDILHALAMNQEMIEEGSSKSIAWLTEAIELLDKPEMDAKKANCLMGMGNVYNNAGQVNEALRYYRLAADTFEKHYYLANMAAAYSNIGNCYIKLGDINEAERFLQKSLELRIKFASPDDLSISYYNLAVVHKERKHFDKAEECLLKSKEILERVGNKPYIAEVNDRLLELEQMRKSQATS